MHAMTSGLVMTNVLCHDFVLRRNCRIAFKLKQATEFTQSTYGSHHVLFVSNNAELWNVLVSKERSPEGKKLKLLPILPNVESGEKFGLVESRYSSSFKGLVEIESKEEPQELDLAALDDGVDADDIGWMLKDLNIDPSLLDQPQSANKEVQPDATHLARPTPITIDISNSPPPLPPLVNKPAMPSAAALGKRKEIDAPSNNEEVDSDVESESPTTQWVAKRARVGSVTAGGTSVSSL